MGIPKWCKDCGDYVPNISDHKKQHNIGRNIDAVEHKQYTGFTGEQKDDYMICVLHQKKIPCTVSGCNGMVFGYIRKSFMMNCIKGLSLNKAEHHLGKIHEPYFPVSNDNNMWYRLPIDMETRTVVIKGATIHLRF